MIEIRYCGECYDKIRNYGELIHELFEKICESYAVTGKCIMVYSYDKMSGNKIIKFLEDRRYIVSTECCIDNLVVKPLGIRYQDLQENKIYSVCFNRDEHD